MRAFNSITFFSICPLGVGEFPESTLVVTAFTSIVVVLN